ncbi:MAG: nuclease A inhibitor family protein [Cyanobacteria bacterium J06626_23]
MSVDCLIQQLQTLVDGLLWSSESDYPVEVVCWAARCQPLTAQDVLLLGQHSPDAAIEIISLDHLFRRVTVKHDWHSEEETAQVERFQQLKQRLSTDLRDVQVYRVGEVEITVYALGHAKDGQILGIRTQVVET